MIQNSKIKKGLLKFRGGGGDLDLPLLAIINYMFIISPPLTHSTNPATVHCPFHD